MLIFLKIEIKKMTIAKCPIKITFYFIKCYESKSKNMKNVSIEESYAKEKEEDEEIKSLKKKWMAACLRL